MAIKDHFNVSIGDMQLKSHKKTSRLPMGSDMEALWSGFAEQQVLSSLQVLVSEVRARETDPKSITATILIAIFAMLGATFESHNVVATVGTGIIRGEDMTPLGAMTMMFTAAVVTAANTWTKWPVSTSQLACFSVVGSALAMGAPVFWGTTIIFLCVTWVATPIVAAILGYVFTHLTDWIMKGRSQRAEKFLGYFLVVGCCYAAYTLGANNTGNAVGVFFGLKLTTEMQAGFIGGIVIAVRALTLGRPILEKVGKGIVQLDLNMGVGAKVAQSITAHTCAFMGYPTSMNQALI
ncbi:MAG: inorganic phosphate transporter [Desulfomonile tiedjei]|uniref:Inorganic phosphate transporter n=1 Tax=Desulfomonile tiedjei TaxID=2358 RepID=A0A9D6Z5Q0_9BACT|nr:inorganic phosphate transporter [Desulfomonile tiedjei]